MNLTRRSLFATLLAPFLPKPAPLLMRHYGWLNENVFGFPAFKFKATRVVIGDCVFMRWRGSYHKAVDRGA